MDGWGVLRVLSDRDAAPRVVVVSAKSSDRDVVRALTSGALAYITKPFDPDALIDIVERTMRSSIEELEAQRQKSIDRSGGVQ
jgi:DNA-binding response OmpR family regulator